MLLRSIRNNSIYNGIDGGTGSNLMLSFLICLPPTMSAIFSYHGLSIVGE